MTLANSLYSDLTKEELIRLLDARDRRDVMRFGLVWEANEIERDKVLNQDFVALDLDQELSCGEVGDCSEYANRTGSRKSCSKLWLEDLVLCEEEEFGSHRTARADSVNIVSGRAQALR